MRQNYVGYFRLSREPEIMGKYKVISVEVYCSFLPFSRAGKRNKYEKSFCVYYERRKVLKYVHMSGYLSLLCSLCEYGESRYHSMKLLPYVIPCILGS